MRKQTVPARDVEDLAAAEEPPRPARNFPGFIEFLTRQAAGLTQRTSDAIEKRAAREPPEIVHREPGARGRRESDAGTHRDSLKHATCYLVQPGDGVIQHHRPMDTTTLLIIVVVILVLGGGGFYYRGRR